MELKVSINEAIVSLGKFRDEHVADYKEAVTKWREAMAKYTKDLDAWADADQTVFVNRPSEPHRPRNYLGEYDRWITKLGRHKDETIIVSDHEYSILFEDNFHWKNQFSRQISADYISAGSISANTITSASLTGSMMSTDKIKLGDIYDPHIPLEDE